MGSRNSSSSPNQRLTMEDLYHETPPQNDEAKQLVRAAAIFWLGKADQHCIRNLHPATQLVLDMFSERGLTSDTRKQAVQVVISYRDQHGGVLFEIEEGELPDGFVLPKELEFAEVA